MAIAAAAALFCLGLSAQAQNATWIGAGSDWNDNTNWLPTTVPTGVATFDTSSATTVFVFANTSVGEIRFPATANSFSIYIDATLSINGAGIISNSSNTQYFNLCNCGTLNFYNSATISSTVNQNIWIYNANRVNFYDNSSAGNAFIDNQNTLAFYNSSTAGTSEITNSRYLQFFNSSSAGNATITNWDNASFFDTSTAGTATITNNSVWAFYNSSTAGFATITNSSDLSFNDAASAGNANITNNSSSTINFNSASSTEFSTAANATITNDGEINFNGYSTAGNANITNN